MEELSDDLDSLMFGLGGVVYTLPVHFSELEANGWSIYDKREDLQSTTYMLEPGHRGFWWILTDGDRFVEVNFINFSEEVLPVSESYIADVSTSQPIVGEQPIFPGNITIGSTYEDVLAKYGEPCEKIERASDEFHRLSYYKDYLHVSIRVCNQTNRVVFVGISYRGG